MILIGFVFIILIIFVVVIYYNSSASRVVPEDIANLDKAQHHLRQNNKTVLNHFSNEVGRFIRPRNSIGKEKTLIIIVGMARTINNCVFSLIDNVITPNEPCDVVLSMDEKDKYSTVVRTALYKWLLPRPDPKQYVTKSHIEFQLSKRATDQLPDPSLYKYALITRTDLYIKSKFDIRTLYGDCTKEQFNKAFTKFKLDVEELVKEELTIQYTLYLWFASAGIPRYAEIRHKPTDKNDESVYVPDTVKWHSIAEQLNPMREKILHMTPATIQNVHGCAQTIARKVKLMYVVGSTWIRFGRAEYMFANVNDLHTNWGREFSGPPPEFNAKNITESQLRLAIHDQYQLVDMKNEEDYIASFKAESGVLDDLLMDDTVGIFLLRNKYYTS